jgi:phosphopantothenoylcysteine decarboxylase / phosphopantothenate---cysteine ligase
MKKEYKNILVGVCGGIAAYKVCQLVRILTKNGYPVKVMMTPAATEFVRPLVFKELTKNPVYLDMFSDWAENTQHIKLSEWADLAILAPLSANTLSKLTSGICDNLLTTVICALNPDKSVLLVPSMNENMWQNPIIQKNLSSLKKIKNYIIFPPEKGELACQAVGVGRMPDAAKIYKKALILLR